MGNPSDREESHPNPTPDCRDSPAGPGSTGVSPDTDKSGQSRRPSDQTALFPSAASGKQTPWLLQYADFDYAAFMRRRNVRRIVVVLIAVAALLFCFWLSAIFIPLLVALLIAYVLNPAVTWLENRGATRLRAVVLVFVLFFSLTVAVLALAIPTMIQNIGQLAHLLQDVDAINEYLRKLAGTWNDLTPVASWHIDPSQVDAGRMLAELVGGTTSTAATDDVAHTAIEAASKIFGHLIAFGLFVTLVPLYTFYFMLGLDRVWENIRAYLPGTQRDRILRILNEIHLMVSAFFRGRLAVCLIVSAMTIALLMIAGVPYAIFLGLLGGFGVIIPFFPMVASLLPAVLIMLATGDFTTGQIVLIAAVFLAIQGTEQFLLTPKILGKAVELHPVTLLVGVFVMASLFGVFGALLAVPLTAIAKILGREFILPYFKQVANERPREPGQSGETSVMAAVAANPANPGDR